MDVIIGLMTQRLHVLKILQKHNNNNKYYAIININVYCSFREITNNDQDWTKLPSVQYR